MVGFDHPYCNHAPGTSGDSAEQLFHRGRIELIDALEFLGMRW